MANSGDLLTSLEIIMTEFFYPTTSNERKRDIEVMLESFTNEENSYRHCLYFIEKSLNQYVCMFALNTIENTVSKKWNRIDKDSVHQIHKCLWTYLTNNHYKIPPFLRNKAIKITVDITRKEYLFSHSDFMMDLFHEIRKGGQSTVLGLLILRNMTEGYDTQGRLHTDSIQGKRTTVERNIINQMPRLMFILIDILKQLSDNQDIYLEQTPDPPPSPERNEAASPSNYPHALLPDLLASRTNPVRSDAYKGVEEECICLCLNILQNLFVWLPMSANLQPNIITIIFHWASISPQSKFSEDVYLAGISALNELMYRRATPPGSEFALRLGHGICKLLNHITEAATVHDLSFLSNEYIDKVSDFLRMFVSKSLKQLETEAEFDSMAFLSLLFRFTFQVPKGSNFILCLDVWTQFIDNLKKNDTVKYIDVFLGLVNAILQKVLYQRNHNELVHLNNQTLNDDGETEWQIYLKHCIEAIGKVADHIPLQVFNLVFEVWQESVNAHAVGHVNVNQLKDLASLTQLLGRLLPTLFNDVDDTLAARCLMQADKFLECLLIILQRVSATDQRIILAQPKPMMDALIQVHADVLACVGGVIPYVSQNSIQPEMLLRSAVTLLMPSTPQIAPVLSHAAAHLLLSLGVSLKISNPLQYLGDLIPQAQKSLAHLEPKTAAILRQALCVMVLQSPAEGAQTSDRIRQCSSLIDSWCAPLITASSGSPMGPICKACLPPLSQILDYFTQHNTQTKKMLMTSVERPVQAALVAFQSSNGDGEVSTVVLEMFLSLLGSLHQQLGNDFVQQSIGMFLDVAKSKQEQSAIQKLLQVLKLCIDGGALPREHNLTEILQLCIQHILPLLSTADPDVALALFQLFGSILLNRWQYFYSSCVRLGWSPLALESGESSIEDGQREQHAEEFRAILRAIIASFLTDHIEVFRVNLSTLEKLNTRCKLFQKNVFKQEILTPLLGVLIGALVQGNGPARLLQDDVAALCYLLASQDFYMYYTRLLPDLLSTLQPQLQAQQIQEILSINHSTDSPSFTYSFITMVDDIRCLLGE